MEEAELLSGFTLELRRGLVPLSVLSQLERPMYGYSLLQILEERHIPMDAGTLYPLMRRLEKQGLLTSSWETSGAKPRKYYVRTELGSRIYHALCDQWHDMTVNLENLLHGKTNQEAGYEDR